MIDIVITVLEMEDYNSSSLPATAGRAGIASSNLAMMNLLAGCMTVASAALVHAGADCLDLLSGGVAALVQDRGKESKLLTALDPAPLEHDRILAACVVGYLKSRDEIVELWHTSAADVSAMIDDEEVTKLMDEAVNAAKLSRLALVGALDTRLMADGQSTIRKTEQERRMDQMDLR